MDAVTELKQKIGELEKHLSLRQVALQSGINYITLRNIKFGKSSRVTDSVMQRLLKFYSGFNPSKNTVSTKKRGPKPKAAKNAVQGFGRKPGPKPGKKAAKKTALSSGDEVLSAIDQKISDLESQLSDLRGLRTNYLNTLG